MFVTLRALAVIVVVASSLLADVRAEVPAAVGDWPQWRGPHRNNLSDEKGLARSWPEGGPPVVWSVNTVGVGYSSLAVKGKRLVTQGDVDGVEKILCLNTDDGSTVWAVQPEPVGAALVAKLANEAKRLDKNADGTIDEAEALAGIGPDFNNFDSADAKADAHALAEARAAKLVKALDVDGDGKISAVEAAGRFRNKFSAIDQADKSADAATLAKQRTAAILKAFDKNADGVMAKNEAQGSPMQDPFGRADQKAAGSEKGDDKLTPEEIETFLTKNEAGKDGALTAAELAAEYERAHAGKDGVLTPSELQGYFGGYRNSYGDGPRGTPTIDGELIYVEGGNGDVTCLELATGKTVWHKNLSTDFGGRRPGWGYSESPLVEGELLIVTPGGAKGSLLALNKLTGQEVWRSVDDTEGAHYASPQVADIAGERQVVQFASKNLFGVRLADGKLLWTYSHANNGTANIATPIIRGDYVYASSGYGTGGGLVHIKRDGDKYSAEEIYFDKTLANHHGGLVLVGEHLFGFGSNGLICQNFMTGENAWKARSVSKGSLTYADGLLFLLGEKHEVALAEAAYDDYRETGRFTIENHGRASWAHPVVAGGRLYIRNMHQLTAYDVRAK